jgi:hypothetical protein
MKWRIAGILFTVLVAAAFSVAGVKKQAWPEVSSLEETFVFASSSPYVETTIAAKDGAPLYRPSYLP